MSADATKTVILGPEHDDTLRSVLVDALRELGATQQDHSWGLAGSQELEKLDILLEGETITIEAETFIGLSISGEPSLVDKIEALVRARMPQAMTDRLRLIQALRALAASLSRSAKDGQYFATAAQQVVSWGTRNDTDCLQQLVSCGAISQYADFNAEQDSLLREIHAAASSLLDQP